MPSSWEQVDLDSDQKYFNLVEGDAEENRLNQKTEAEQIAQRDFKSIELIDPLTDKPILGLEKILNKYKGNSEKIIINSLNFDADTYLREVHALTGIAQMQGFIDKLYQKTKNRGKD